VGSNPTPSANLLFTLVHPCSLAGRATELVDDVHPVRDQASGGDVIVVIVDRGQLVARRQRDDQVAMKNRQRAPGHDQPAVRLRAKAATARSISPASVMLTGLTSIATEGDTD
jgi:hypothetical protein